MNRVPSQPVMKNTISKDQLKTLNSLLDGEYDLVDSILKGYKIVKLSDLPKEKYGACLLGIKERKEKK